MHESDPRLLTVLEQISAQQIALAQGQARTISILNELVDELRKPAEVNTLAALEQLLKPLVQQLAELSRKLPEPPNA